MKKVLTITIIALLIFAAVQISVVIALNNSGTLHLPFVWGRYSGILRTANDSDSPLSSWANTGVFSRAPDEELDQDLLYNWSASAGVDCYDSNYRGSYDLHAQIMTFEMSDDGDYVGILSESVGFYVQMEPPPDNVTLDIEDCQSHGELDGENQLNGNSRQSRSQIPF
jgi:hypothetical protein